ncbi:MAG: hypothetical protein QOE29_2365, partial [Gaiellaceae bacterium]|nr:hypothetical protein [Gaiellaceae bacterium]
MSRSPLPFEPATLVELLRWRAEHQPDELAYTFLLDGEEERAQISFAELDEKARGLAATLQELDGEGGRALMLYPPGIDYVVSFFGCLYARVIAVPAYPPRLGRPNPRIAAIVNDSTPAFLLAPDFIRAHQSSMISQNPELGSMRWIAPDADVEPAAAASWREPGAGTDTLAFLQYTSGSTGDPNGVMVSHGNLLSNLATAQSAFHYTAETIGFSWLPPYHDMGLIGGVLHPMYGGFEIVLMSPISFLQRPARWLEAISRHRATVTGGPSSAYQLCVDRVTAEERSGLYLSCLDSAV